MENTYCYKTPIGYLTIGDNGSAITKIQLEKTENTGEESALAKKAHEQLSEYFQGKRREFNLPLEMKGTEFQKKVWQELLKIPYGSTCSYKDIAIRIGNENAVRAVGGANNKNAIMIVVPCHRVVGISGALTGYACGLDIKKHLLDLEKKWPQEKTDISLREH
ncbi:methylated-DNA--[protein]-cysteine S-methyltransferase [Treponema sp.]|uniref:methylated-DNA--[protein]-cysteine S-methyltransferase n=1 Tax=Treponema sp. TaxID=166 RepID=UPI003F0A141A